MHSRSRLCVVFVLVRMETLLRGYSDECAAAVATRSTASSRKGAPVVTLWGEGLCVVWGWVVDSGGLQGFFALDARAAFATMVRATLVAAPCFGIVAAEPFANARDVGF